VHSNPGQGPQAGLHYRQTFRVEKDRWGEDVKLLMVFALGSLIFVTACAAGGKAERTYYGDSLDCQAILSDWYGGPEKLPPGCIERGR